MKNKTDFIFLSNERSDNNEMKFISFYSSNFISNQNAFHSEKYFETSQQFRWQWIILKLKFNCLFGSKVLNSNESWVRHLNYESCPSKAKRNFAKAVNVKGAKPRKYFLPFDKSQTVNMIIRIHQFSFVSLRFIRHFLFA